MFALSVISAAMTPHLHTDAVAYPDWLRPVWGTAPTAPTLPVWACVLAAVAVAAVAWSLLPRLDRWNRAGLPPMAAGAVGASLSPVVLRGAWAGLLGMVMGVLMARTGGSASVLPVTLWTIALWLVVVADTTTQHVHDGYALLAGLAWALHRAIDASTPDGTMGQAFLGAVALLALLVGAIAIASLIARWRRGAEQYGSWRAVAGPADLIFVVVLALWLGLTHALVVVWAASVLGALVVLCARVSPAPGDPRDPILPAARIECPPVRVPFAALMAGFALLDTLMRGTELGIRAELLLRALPHLLLSVTP